MGWGWGFTAGGLQTGRGYPHGRKTARDRPRSTALPPAVQAEGTRQGKARQDRNRCRCRYTLHLSLDIQKHTGSIAPGDRSTVLHQLGMYVCVCMCVCVCVCVEDSLIGKGVLQYGMN